VHCPLCPAPLPPFVGGSGTANVADLPTSVWGIASDRVARVELRVDGGGTFDGELYAITRGSIDTEQAFLFLVPVEGPMTGTVVAFDSRGEELQQREVESLG
jgi:hypothetical protein